MNKYIDIKNLIKLILVFLLFYYNKIFAYILASILKIDISNISIKLELLFTIFSSFCLLIILFIIYRKDLLEDFKKLKKNLFKTLDNSFKYYLFGMIGMMITNILFSFIFKDNGPNNEKIVQSMISASPYLMLINAGILAPIIEEIVFRKTYKDAFKNKYLFLIISSLVFGIMHVVTSSNNLYEYLYFIPYSLLGLSLAYMDYEEDNIFPSIIIHILHNSILTIVSICL